MGLLDLFYKVNSLDTCVVIHISLLLIICTVTAFDGGSVLRRFADIPVAYYNFHILRSVVTKFSESGS